MRVKCLKPSELRDPVSNKLTEYLLQEFYIFAEDYFIKGIKVEHKFFQTQGIEKLKLNFIIFSAYQIKFV